MTDKKPRSDVLPRLSIPEHIRLPDGRTFDTQELLNQCQRAESYNLRSRTPSKPIVRNRPGNSKYHRDDWIFIRDNSTEQISARYNIVESYARILKNKCQTMLKKWPMITK